MVINAEQQRERINNSGIEMLTLCISQFEKATDAFLNHDSDLAEEVINIETRVNALDLKIENDCENFLALYNPVAVDLRFIMATLKINFDLERIADHAFGIAKYIIEQDKKIAPHLLEAVGFEKMYDTIIAMFENIQDGFVEQDVKVVRKVFKKDKILDKINLNAFKIVEKEIKKDTALINEALLLFVVIKKFERVGDLIKNIAEETIFYIDAEVVKHRKKK